MFNLYTFEDWNGNIRIMSSSKIHKRIMNDSKKSNYGWIASATELVNVCDKKGFPEEYAIDIKVAILNCYSVSMHSFGDDFSFRKETDLDAVYYAYNSLYGMENKKVIQARTRFLYSFLLLIIDCSNLGLFHRGEQFEKACNEWKKKKFDELFVEEKTDFNCLFSILEDDFSEKIKELEESGIFDEEDKKEKEILQKYIDNSAKQFYELYSKPVVLKRVPKQ